MSQRIGTRVGGKASRQANRSATIESLEPRRLLAAAPFAIGGDPSVHPQDFRVTTFASGLNFPVGMQQLADGSILVATSTPTPGGGYFSGSVGQLRRFTDLNHDGVADDAGTVVADNLPGEMTDVRVAGNLVFVTTPGRDQHGPSTITILRTGRTPSSPFARVGSLTLTYPQPWEHLSYALETRPTPGSRGSYDVFFNVGAKADTTTTPPTDTVALASDDGKFSGTLRPDSIYKVTVTDGRRGVVFSNLTEIAYGLRNAAGIAVQPGTGDLYFEDNGIDGPQIDPQLSADELNVIRAGDIGKSVPDFGFAHDYINQVTGQRVGSGGVQPLVAFLPINGSRSEGPEEIAFTPKAFPPGLNGGVMVGFFGRFAYTGDGTQNDENPVLYADLKTKKYFQFVSNNEPAIGHAIGFLSTSDSIFMADQTATNDFNTPGTGAVYQITALPRPFTINGTVFADGNRNGRLDAGERAMGRTAVFLDRNDNGVVDAGEEIVTSDRRGHYDFGSFPAGSYHVRALVRSGTMVTTGADRLVVLGRRHNGAGTTIGLAAVTGGRRGR